MNEVKAAAERQTPEWPKIGERYVWEMLSPHAAFGVEVANVCWNGEAWLVETCGVLPSGERDRLGSHGWTHLARFQEACLPYRAYLAEHPPDDEAAIDEAWLRACGGLVQVIPAEEPDEKELRVYDFG